MQLATPAPNTCTRCEQALGDVCYAENLDAALAGQGWCEACEAAATPVTVTQQPKKAKRV